MAEFKKLAHRPIILGMKKRAPLLKSSFDNADFHANFLTNLI